MKINWDECYLLISGQKCESVWASIGYCKIWESFDQKISWSQHWLQFKIQSLYFKMMQKSGQET